MLYDQSSPKPLAKDKKGRRTKEGASEKRDGEGGETPNAASEKDSRPNEAAANASNANRKEKEKSERPDEDGEDQSKMKLHAELFAAIKLFLDEMLAEIKQSSTTWKVCVIFWKGFLSDFEGIKIPMEIVLH
jgi:hypothetical protein